tara:strand:+ start:1 stop:2919 length:2919 start_codon:yes stop_codon:yes gene_type:complete
MKYKFIIFNIQKNYNFLSKYLINQEKHINNLYSNNIISLYKKNLNLNNLLKVIKSLNLNYNYIILNKIDELLLILDKININISDEKHFSFYRDYIINLYIIDYDNILNELLYSLDKNRKEVFQISKDIGCSDINLILELVYKSKVKNIFDEKTYKFLLFLSDVFTPLNFYITNKSFKSKGNNNNLYDFDKIKIYYCSKNNDELLNKIVDVEINYFSENIIISGIFKTDSCNILLKSCQIYNKFIYYKKKKLDDLLSNCRATKKFIKSFIKICMVDEILCYDNNEFISFVDLNYDKYISLIGKTFMNIMKDFIKKNNTITDMFNTIRLLLLGNEENVNVAGLLFEITKDKKISNNIIYNLIYNNLHFSLQVKIKKSISDIKANLKKIQRINNDVDLKKQILSLVYMPLNVKSMAIEKIEEMKSANNEYYKQQLYVKTLIKFPWSSLNEDNYFVDLNNDISKRKFYINNIENKLIKATYGHEETKKSLIEIIAKWISNPVSSGSSISLCGPPGVGKTLLAKKVSDILNIPFCHIALGGQNDGELLHGHGYTYSGSQPGLIIKKMADIGKSRAIIYFDELDKTCKKNGSNEITNILIHLTDPNMNSSFQDRFFQGIDFPLNKVIYIFSYNDSSKIDPILLDRLQQINIKPYSLDDKIQLFKDFLFKEVCESIGFSDNEFKISDETIKFLINNYTLEAGVRELKRKIEKMLLILNVDRLYQRNLFKSKNNKKIIINKTLIKKLLLDADIEIEKIHKIPLVGIVNGLYATTSGFGGIVPIQITSNYLNNESSFNLRLTGSQGDVMKESVQCALTCCLQYLEKNLNKYGIKCLKSHIEKYWKSGFHIHAPNGATPKDGPSAGCAFTLAFISKITNIPIDNTVAMTGEIDLLGNITKIGGLEYKINGGKKAGIKRFFISEENKEDYQKIKKKDNKIDQGIEIIYVNDISELVQNTLDRNLSIKNDIKDALLNISNKIEK